jgi:hypothetical protein
MRHIFHEILERYLNSEQAAFDTSVRELWPTERYALRPRSTRSGSGSGTGRGRKPAREGADYREPEYRN